MDRAREIMAPIVDDVRRPARGLGGKRWYRCEECGKVGPADEFAAGDTGCVWNRGICFECAGQSEIVVKLAGFSHVAGLYG